MLRSRYSSAGTARQLVRPEVVTHVAGTFRYPCVQVGHSLDWWARQDLNLGPTDYESAALTAELRAPRELTH